MSIKLHFGDSLESMLAIRSNAYDVALTDMPYGIGESKKTQSRPKLCRQKNGRFLRVKGAGKHVRKDWDSAPPTDAFFEQLFRVSQNQILFGGNYFTQLGPVHKTPRRQELPAWIEAHPTGWVVWDKATGKSDFNDFELIWTSYNRPTVVLPFLWSGFLQGISLSDPMTPRGDKSLNQSRIHPTEKPFEVLGWLLKEFVPIGSRVIDPCAGSFSLGVVAHRMGYACDGWEKDIDYYLMARSRLHAHQSQLDLLTA